MVHSLALGLFKALFFLRVFCEVATVFIREAVLSDSVCRVAVLDRVTDFLLFLGKVLIAGGVGK